MGFFSDFLKNSKALTRISEGVANVTNLLDQFERDDDVSFLFFAAWITRVAVLDVVEENNLPMTYSLFVPMHGHQTRINIGEAYMLTVNRIQSKSQEASLHNRQFITEILEKGKAFYEMDEMIPEDKKRIFK